MERLTSSQHTARHLPVHCFPNAVARNATGVELTLLYEAIDLEGKYQAATRLQARIPNTTDFRNTLQTATVKTLRPSSQLCTKRTLVACPAHKHYYHSLFLKGPKAADLSHRH